MILKTLQWNIGGGKIKDRDSVGDSSYSLDGMDHIVETIRKYNPDVITLQETHADEKIIQAKIIADKLSDKYFFNDVYDQSHIERGQGLGLAIISKYPIKNHAFEFFFNPKYETLGPDGSQWISHDKGLSSCVVQLPNTNLTVLTLHLIPFRKFNVDPLKPECEKVREDILEKIKRKAVGEKILLQGDFNFDNETIESFLPKSLGENTKEVKITEGTTPKGRKYDHVVFSGLKPINSIIDTSTLTDHFPLIVEFQN